MFDKVIDVLLGSADKLKQFDIKTQAEIVKYSNNQIKKTVIVCYTLGFATALFLVWFI